MERLHPVMVIMLIVLILLIMIALLITLVILTIYRNRTESEEKVYIIDSDQKQLYDKWSALNDEEKILVSKLIDNMK